MVAQRREYHGHIRTEHTILTRCAVGHIPSILRIGEITTPIATIIASITIRSVCILCFSIVFSSLKYKADHKQRIPGKKFPGCCSLPLDFGGRSSLTSSHSENTDSHRLHDPSGKISGTSPSCQTLRRSPSCPLFRRSSQKERIPPANATETRSHITIPPLALPKSGTVEDLSSSQPVTQAPAGSFLFCSSI